MIKSKLASPVCLAIATALLAAPAFAQTPAAPATPPAPMPMPMTSTPAPAAAAPAPAAAAPATAAPAATMPMKSMQGMPAKGAKPSAATRMQWVEKLQTALNASGATLTVDGKMGPKTRAALMDFQKSKGLKATGRVDKETIAALKAGG